MKNPLIGDVRLYQRFISPGLSACCHYYPTCLQCITDAIHTHGSVRGTTMEVARTLRCHPFVKGGIDYVPLELRLTRSPGETCHGPYMYRRSKKTEAEKDE